MTSKMLLIGAIALVFSPSATLAATGGARTSTTTSQTSLPSPTTGQPSQDCVSLVDSGMGSFPGHATTSPGSAFNEDPGGVAGSKYAGEQPQNSKNATSVSQYDVACLHGTR